MTLSKVEVRTDQGVLLSLPLDDISEGVSVQDIKGLDPVPANIVSSSFARLDGEQFQSARREKRNPIFQLGLEPDYTNQTVSQIRNRLYHFFLPKKNANMRFFTDDFPTGVDISGRVETFDCPLFVKEPVATISLLCFDPDFYEPVQITVGGTTIDGTTMGNIDYAGTVDTGILFNMVLDRSVSTFTIYHQPEGESIQTMQVTGNFLSGDEIEISTVPGNKYATIKRGGVLSSILYSVSPYATWTRLQPGNNALRVATEGASIPYTIKYTNKHGGL